MTDLALDGEKRWLVVCCVVIGLVGCTSREPLPTPESHQWLPFRCDEKTQGVLFVAYGPVLSDVNTDDWGVTARQSRWRCNKLGWTEQVITEQ
jgi:hypothetical protein